MATQQERVKQLSDSYSGTYAAEAGIRLADKPAALYQLLVLSTLLSARISADIAVNAQQALLQSGLTTPQRMLGATWQQRVDALGRGHYRRYDERTATQLGDGAQMLVDNWRGDLRRLHHAHDDVPALRKALQEFPGVGPAGSAIFVREVQDVWTDCAPFFDDRALRGAERAGLPIEAKQLARLAGKKGPATFAAVLVRVSLDRSVQPDD